MLESIIKELRLFFGGGLSLALSNSWDERAMARGGGDLLGALRRSDSHLRMPRREPPRCREESLLSLLPLSRSRRRRRSRRRPSSRSPPLRPPMRFNESSSPRSSGECAGAKSSCRVVAVPWRRRMRSLSRTAICRSPSVEYWPPCFLYKCSNSELASESSAVSPKVRDHLMNLILLMMMSSEMCSVAS